MLTYTPCHPRHVRLIEPQDHDRRIQPEYLRPENAYYIKDNFSITVWDKFECVMVGGLLTLEEDGSALAWSLMSKNVGWRRLMEITKRTKDAFDISPFKKIYMNCNKDFLSANKWARMLGFKVLCPDAEGQTIYTWERVNG